MILSPDLAGVKQLDDGIAADLIPVGGDAERYRRLVRGGPDIDIDVGYGCLSSEDSIQLRMRQPPHFFSR
jgi:hypothetical protein